MFHSVLERIKNTPITISQWFVGFAGIIFIRFIFESLSTTTRYGFVMSDEFTLAHTALYFLCITLGLSLIVGYFVREYATVLKVFLFGLPIIWLGPILDMIISSGRGYEIGYIRDTGMALIRDFLTFFGPNFVYGATPGLRIEMALVLVAIGYYVWTHKKSWVQSILAVLLSYIFIFISFILPGLLYTLAHGAGGAGDVVAYTAKVILGSNIAHNTYRNELLLLPIQNIVEMGFDKLFSQIFFIFSCIFGTLLFWKINSKKLISVVKNIRLERVLFFLGLLGFGMGYAYLGGYGHFTSYVDVMSACCMAIAWVGAWAYAVHINDLADVAIDTISNKDRPIVKQQVTVRDMKETGYVWLLIALAGAWSAGYYPFYMVIAYTIASYIYSVPPLRLRVLPMLSSFLISFACLVSVLAGFFFVSFDKRTGVFPLFVALGILVVFTLIINIKDVKDAAGDKADGIYTLPTLFGKDGQRAVGYCFAFGILLVPFFLSFYTLYLTAIPTAIIGYKIITKKPFVEKKVFILGFIFLLLSLFLFLSIKYLAGVYNL